MVQLIVATALAVGLGQAPARPVPAVPEGRVTGSVTIAGTKVALRYVYVSVQPAAVDRSVDDVKVLFSDVPLDDEARADVLARIRLAREGRAHLVEVVVAPSGVPVSGTFYGREFDGMVPAEGLHQFTRDRFDDKVIAGRLYSERRRSFQGVSVEYDATFLSPIPRPRGDAGRAAAVASPAGLAAETHLAAIRSGAMSVLAATVTAEMGRELAGGAGAQRLAEWRRGLPTDARVVDVQPQADGSVSAVVEGHADGALVRHTWRLVLESGTWRVRR